MTADGFDANGDLIIDAPNDIFSVAAIQAALRDLRYPLIVTFQYDQATADAVRQFKIDQTLPLPVGLAQHDGVVGPGTSARLNELFSPPKAQPQPPSQVPAPPALQAWGQLISFRPPVSMQATLNSRFGIFGGPVVHRLEDARGPINLDYYPVRISAMPLEGGQTMTAEQLLELVRRNFNNFVDSQPEGCTFHPYDPNIDTAAWLPPFIQTAFPGAVVSIDMFSNGFNIESGSVVLSEVAADHWIFSTLWTPSDLGHPVTGNRQWGFVPVSAGEFIFFTRGADRTTARLDQQFSQTVFGSAHKLWLSFQRRLAAYVNNNGGLAVVEPATSDRYDWFTVQATYHRPTVPWM